MEILDYIQKNISNEVLDGIMRFITAFGNYAAIWILTAAVFVVSKKHRTVGIAILTALAAGYVIGNLIMKPLFARVRPNDVNAAIDLLIARPTDHSFPSGHALSSFAAATVIFCANKRLGVAALLLAAAIAFSRLYLYVHYLSDVLVGSIIGVAIGVAAHFTVKHWVCKLRTQS